MLLFSCISIHCYEYTTLISQSQYPEIVLFLDIQRVYSFTHTRFTVKPIQYS